MGPKHLISSSKQEVRSTVEEETEEKKLRRDMNVTSQVKKKVPVVRVKKSSTSVIKY